MNEEKIIKIIAKVRQMYKYDKRFADILANPAHIAGAETKKNGVELLDIIWSFYGDQIIVGRKRIVYRPEHGRDEELVTYDSFEELLRM